MAIHQDKLGYMWFGTSNGLNRFDGYDFKVYTNIPTNNNSISNNEVEAIFEDKDGYLWFGTANGILEKFNPTTETFSHFDLANSSEWSNTRNQLDFSLPITFSRNKYSSITTINMDSLGYLWIGTWGKGLIRFNPVTNEKKYFYNSKTDPNSISSNRITKIIKDSNGQMWIGTFGGGLNKISNYESSKKIKFVSLNEVNPFPKFVTAVHEYENGRLLIGCYLEGVFRLNLNGNNFNSINLKKDNDLLNVTSISQTENKSIWIGTSGQGLFEIDDKLKLTNRYTTESLSANPIGDNEIQTLFADNSGELWIGFQLGEGLNKLEYKTNKFFTIPSQTQYGRSLNDNVVWSITEDSDSNLLIGTYRGGLNIINQKTKTYEYYLKDKINDNHIRPIIEDYRKNLWIGTYAGGLTYFNRTKNVILNFSHNEKNEKSISANQIQSLLIEDSTLWIGTFGGGLNKLNLSDFYKSKTANFEVFRSNPADNSSIVDDRVYELFKSINGDFWIGTHGGGICKFNENRDGFINFNKNGDRKNQLSNSRVMVIEETTDGQLLIGSFGGGIDIFDPTNGKFENLNKKIGIDCNDIYGILSEPSNGFWISSDKGIYKLSENLLTYRKYDLEDGLQSLEFNGGAYYKSKNGTFYFGGINGLNFFNPQNIELDVYLPQVVITEISVFDKPIKGQPKSLTFGRDENYFSFEFASLDFTNSKKNKYRYKLKGFDENWYYTDSKNRKVYYTNLDPGEYNFVVHGTNSDGIWSPKSASLAITILAPFWMQWWFILGLILFIGGLVLFYINQRFRYLVAMDRLKTNLSADLHDNVGAGLTEISILSELAVNQITKPNLAEKHLNHISELSRNLVESMSDIVWVVNPKTDSFSDLIVRLKDNYGEVLSELGITLETSDLDELNKIKLSTEQRQNLYLILKESINNSLKYSKCSKIILDIKIQNKEYDIQYSDNGIGFESDKVKMGNGLRNMQSRSRKIKAQFSYSSNPNVGTRINIKGKIK